jgi:hypothetical protein
MTRHLLTLWVVAALTLASSAAWAASEVRLPNGSGPDPLTSTPQKRRPVLFVHGHNSDDANDADFNFQKNWTQAVNGLPSFQQTLEDPANAGTLDIEVYFIRFVEQHRSIVEDARDVGDAVERILARHDSSYTPFMANPSTPVRVAIVAFSKGTISARLYLKSLETQQFDLPAPRAGFNPISEFVALSPPNHGIAVSALLTPPSNLAVRQLNNGFRDDCGHFLLPPTGENFIQDLNGHAIADSQSAPLGSFDTEAPLSRHPTDDPVGAGTLYLTIYADLNRDAVGGGAPSGDCQGRLLAKNLAPHARNIEVPEIPDMPQTSVGFGVDAAPLSVHRNTPHTPAVICLTLVTIVHQKAPADDFRCANATGVIPRIPPRAAVVQVLDYSGSMLDPACPTCPSKLEVLQDSVELFIQLWGVLAGPGDRIGTTYFGSQVVSFSTGNQQLVEASSPNLTTLIGDLPQHPVVPANRTAMGGGIQRAIEALETVDTVAIPQRHVIVFTDGMQNQNPMVVPGATGLEIRNDGPFPPSGVPPSSPPRVLDSALGLRIHTVGVGAAPQFVGLLADIAQGTGGQTWITTAPDADLRQFFVEGVIASLQGNTPQLVDYRRGSVVGAGSERFQLEKGLSRAVFTLSWRRGTKLDVRLERNGVDVSSRARVVNGTFYRLFVVERPAAGTWTLRLSGRRGVKYEAAAIVDEHSVRSAVTVGRPILVAGEPLAMRVKVQVARRPLTRASRVVVTILKPGESAAMKAPLVLRLDYRGDGVFAGVFRDTKVPGPYRFVVAVDGRDAKIGDFRRSLSATAVVRSSRPAKPIPVAPKKAS